MKCDCCCVPGCHKNQCSNMKKLDNKKGLLTEFDSDEFNQNQKPSPSPNLITLANTDLCIEDKCDHILLNTAINWVPDGTININNIGSLAIPFAVRARFTIWRGNPFNPSRGATPLCSFIDSAPLLAGTLAVGPSGGSSGGLDISLTGASFAAITTDFKCVDQHPDCGLVEYFLTVDTDILPNATDLPAGITGIKTTAVTFTAMEIKKNDDDCC
ncbi:MAG TPA: hypothetical protein VEY70_07655 [Metabacillus sp.]|nr:hypothetical protein [Metabacillus sp.]